MTEEQIKEHLAKAEAKLEELREKMKEGEDTLKPYADKLDALNRDFAIKEAEELGVLIKGKKPTKKTPKNTIVDALIVHKRKELGIPDQSDLAKVEHEIHILNRQLRLMINGDQLASIRSYRQVPPQDGPVAGDLPFEDEKPVQEEPVVEETVEPTLEEAAPVEEVSTVQEEAQPETVEPPAQEDEGPAQEAKNEGQWYDEYKCTPEPIQSSSGTHIDIIRTIGRKQIPDGYSIEYKKDGDTVIEGSVTVKYNNSLVKDRFKTILSAKRYIYRTVGPLKLPEGYDILIGNKKYFPRVAGQRIPHPRKSDEMLSYTVHEEAENWIIRTWEKTAQEKEKWPIESAK